MQISCIFSYFYEKALPMRFILLFTTIFFFFNSYAQQYRPTSSEKIYKQLKTLKNLPKVLYLAAHPDDENTGLLSWLVNHEHINTAYLSLTRGDGGQNLIGSEQGAALGLIRTHELLEARKVDGAKQFFTTAVDFGFSKNPDDTFKQWNIDSVTADVVWVIRNFKPDVIITRFPPTAAAGHGQHSASAIIAEAAISAASNRNKYPEQLKHVDPWHATRLVWNTFRFGSRNTTSEDQFKITVGQYDPLLGIGYGEMAGISRSLHQSQGAGTPSVAGIRTEYFYHILGDPIKTSLYDGIKLNWTEINREDIDQEIENAISNYNFRQPDLSISQLLKIRKLIRSVDDQSLREEKLNDLDRIILSAAGIMAEMITSQAEALAGEELNFRLNVISRSRTPLSVNTIKLPSSNESQPNMMMQVHQMLAFDSLHSFNYKIPLRHDAEISETYWLKNATFNSSQYPVSEESLIGLPLSPPSFVTELNVQIEDEVFKIKVPASYKKLDPIRGDVVEPLRIVPEVNIRFTQPLYFQKENEPLHINVLLRSYKNFENARLIVKNNKKIIFSLNGISLQASNDTTIHISLDRTKIKTDGNAIELDALLEVGNKSYTKNQQLIQYNHIPVIQYFNSAQAKVISNTVKVRTTNVGYIQGAGDVIPDVLRAAGINVTILENNDLSNASKLSGYDAIVVGIRAVNAEKRFSQWMPILNEYAYNGGTLIMQFNTLQDMSTSTLGPYPFNISRDRVTEENAAVGFLIPDHRLMNYPNKITQDDFNGWIQERGLYFPTNWDDKYVPLFSMNDTGEKALKGALLYAKYGKGHFIYTPLAFFRQLPEGNEGAIKLFFNMLSVGIDEKK